MKPAMIPTRALSPSIGRILDTGNLFEIIKGSISSDVDKKIAISVPREITPPEYKDEAAAENPH